MVVQRIAREMRSESRPLAHILKDLEYSANALKRAATAAWRAQHSRSSIASRKMVGAMFSG